MHPALAVRSFLRRVAFNVPLEFKCFAFWSRDGGLALHNLHLSLVNELEGDVRGAEVADEKLVLMAEEGNSVQRFCITIIFNVFPLTSRSLLGFRQTTILLEGEEADAVTGQLVVGSLTVAVIAETASILDSSFFSSDK